MFVLNALIYIRIYVYPLSVLCPPNIELTTVVIIHGSLPTDTEMCWQKELRVENGKREDNIFYWSSRNANNLVLIILKNLKEMSHFKSPGPPDNQEVFFAQQSLFKTTIPTRNRFISSVAVIQSKDGESGISIL